MPSRDEIYGCETEVCNVKEKCYRYNLKTMRKLKRLRKPVLVCEKFIPLKETN